MKSWHLLLFLNVGVTQLCLSSAFIGGAPVAKCGDMTPSHGAAAESAEVPYNITLSSDVYTPSVPMTGKYYIIAHPPWASAWAGGGRQGANKPPWNLKMMMSYAGLLQKSSNENAF